MWGHPTCSVSPDGLPISPEDDEVWGRESGIWHKKNPTFQSGYLLPGGERGIRTLDTLLTYTHFPGVLLQPLGQLSAISDAGLGPVPRRANVPKPERFGKSYLQTRQSFIS